MSRIMACDKNNVGRGVGPLVIDPRNVACS